MRIQVLQHEPFEGPGLIEEWAAERGYDLQVTHMYANEALPQNAEFDWLVIMGGGMSVNDEAILPWLAPEKQFVRDCINRGKVVLGICLGAQLIASVLGARVSRNPQKEIGWYAVELVEEGLTHPLFDSSWNGMFFHWHGETFELPADALQLASSKACNNQAFCLNNRVYGFQFHPETNQQTLHQMVTAGADELQKQPYVMSAEEILAAEQQLQRTRPVFLKWLDKLASVNS